MTVKERIIKLLDEEGVKYEVLSHQPVHTSHQAAKVRDMDLSMGAKALVFFADKKPILAVVPGDTRLNLKKFKKEFEIKDLRMASAEQVLELTSLKIGSIPPIGKSMNLTSYFDSSISKKDKVAFNAGSLTISIKMNAKDLIKVEEPILADIT